MLTDIASKLLAFCGCKLAATVCTLFFLGWSLLLLVFLRALLLGTFETARVVAPAGLSISRQGHNDSQETSRQYCKEFHSIPL